MATGLVFQCVCSSEILDSSAERIKISGVDMSSVEDGSAFCNWEHLQSSDTVKKDSKISPAQEVVGIILDAWKVLKEDECRNDFDRRHWVKLRVPFISGIVSLYDSAGHPGAQAIAAMMRDDQANGRKILCRVSIEGSTLERNGQELTQTIFRALAITTKPANKSCDVEVISDPGAPEGYNKNPGKKDAESQDILKDLLDKAPEHPLYRALSSQESEVELVDLSADSLLTKKELKLLVLAGMQKALSAGGYGAAPGSLTGGSALQVEHLSSVKNRAKAALRDFDANKRHFDKKEFREFAKARLPEVDDAFLDHFTDLAEDLHLKLKKSTPISTLINRFQELTIDLRKAADDVKEDRNQRSVLYAGNRVIPGVARSNNQDWALLDEDPAGYKAVPKHLERNWTKDDLVHLPKHQESTHYTVHSRPSILVRDLGEGASDE